MAYKKYAYYNKGNRVGIVEQSSSSSSGNLAVAHCTISGYTTKDTCEAAGGQWIPSSSGIGSDAYDKYVSPTESVTDGIEIEYTYAPTYRVYRESTIDVNKFYVNGWTVIGGYLTFLRSHALAQNANWTASPYNAVASATSGEGDTGGRSLDYIFVKGSSRWNGLHRVQTAGTLGQLITYTKVSGENLPYWESKQIEFSTSETIFDRGSGLYLADYFSSGDYLWISGETDEGTGQNSGLFSVKDVTRSTTAASSTVELDKKYYINVSNNSATSELGSEGSADAVLANDSAESDINIYKANREHCYLLTDVDVLNDENDEIDLTSYQSKAIVYYLRATAAEDALNIEMREYYMRLFKKQLEKERSARKRGPYIAMGNSNMRTF